jgi:hypothetical protein
LRIESGHTTRLADAKAYPAHCVADDHHRAEGTSGGHPFDFGDAGDINYALIEFFASSSRRCPESRLPMFSPVISCRRRETALVFARRYAVCY